jgi:hypothetical protein
MEYVLIIQWHFEFLEYNFAAKLTEVDPTSINIRIK